MFRFLAFTAALAVSLPQAHAASSKLLVYKHSHWPLSIIEFRTEVTGADSDYAYRYSWPRAIGDAYGLYDTEGEAVADAAFTGSGLLASTFGGAQLTVVAPNDAVLGKIQGSWATWHRAYFTFTDAYDKPLGVAYIDYFGTDIVIVDAKTQHKVLATLTHIEPLVPNESEFWTLNMHDTQAISPVMMRAFAAYMVDYQSWITGFGWTGRTATMLKTWVPERMIEGIAALK